MKRAGFAFNTFYVHFSTRESVLVGVIEDILNPWRAAYEPLLGDSEAQAMSDAIRIWARECRRTNEFARFLQHNGSHLLGVDFFRRTPEGQEGAARPEDLLLRSQIIALLTATATLILLGQAPEEIDTITARAILVLLAIEESVIVSVLANPPLEPPSLEAIMKRSLEAALRENMARADLLDLDPPPAG